MSASRVGGAGPADDGLRVIVLMRSKMDRLCSSCNSDMDPWLLACGGSNPDGARASWAKSVCTPSRALRRRARGRCTDRAVLPHEGLALQAQARSGRCILALVVVVVVVPGQGDRRDDRRDGPLKGFACFLGLFLWRRITVLQARVHGGQPR